MALDLRQILAFIAVANLGSFRRAAERLNTTQPNISARIAKLEARLGQRLMERDAGSVRLTARGKAMLGPALALAAAADDFLAAAEDDGLFEGTIRLGVTELIAHTFLRDYLKALRSRFPNVTVELTVDLSETLSALLADRQIDLAVQNGPFQRVMSGTLAVGSCPFVWVAAPGFVGTRGAMDASAMASLPILTHARGTQPWRQLSEHFRSAGVTARLVPASNTSACLQMTLDGLGIASLPRPMVDAPLAEGRLVLVNYEWKQEDLRFAARWEADGAPAYLVEAARLAVEVVQDDDKKSLSTG